MVETASLVGASLDGSSVGAESERQRRSVKLLDVSELPLDSNKNGSIVHL